MQKPEQWTEYRKKPCSRCARSSELSGVEIAHVAKGRLVGPSGRMSPSSTSPIIRMCTDCLDEVWPSWRDAIEVPDADSE